MIVVLDTGPLGLITHPRATSESQRCMQWLNDLAASGVRVLVPEISDYELRRESLRVQSQRGISALDRVGLTAGYVPISTTTMRRAASLWADARRVGAPTAPDLALDGDVTLGAQAQACGTNRGSRDHRHHEPWGSQAIQ